MPRGRPRINHASFNKPEIITPKVYETDEVALPQAPSLAQQNIDNSLTEEVKLNKSDDSIESKLNNLTKAVVELCNYINKNIAIRNNLS